MGKTYARLRFYVGPGGQILIPVAVDYRLPFAAADHAAWEAEYQAHIQTESTGWDSALIEHEKKDQQIRNAPDDWLEELEGMAPEERRLVLDELAARPELWGDENEVLYG